jgi:hypothetical protein
MPTLFVSVGGAPVLFTLFVFVEELMSCLRNLFLQKSSCRAYFICVSRGSSCLIYVI